ncbi:hypothetical protein [Mucilaginibacter sp. FT3.2]|uniref:hypothetical protein n=1 Tax=Mucilaginibacter sp. FT3.2 TaxID=2723090 RepID=UPI00160EB42E|nr:hypothetical protein [Mucilaginibacter sp. FT3.2]MBB6233781.1 hypothetical protein [Mucilaginibacter sp. FT3.2]
MKLFYHFLFFVFASLILLACASMFASEPQSQSQTDEFSAPEPDGNALIDDSIVTTNSTRPFVLTLLKSNNKVLLPNVKYIAGKKYAKYVQF